MVVPSCQHETGQTTCVDGKAEDRKGDEYDKVNDHNRKDSSTLVQETLAVEVMCRHNTGEKGSGNEQTWLRQAYTEGRMCLTRRPRTEPRFS